MLLSPFPREIDVSPVQSLNALGPRLVTASGITTSVIDVHPLNALSYMFVTLSGRLMSVRPVQL